MKFRPAPSFIAAGALTAACWAVGCKKQEPAPLPPPDPIKVSITNQSITVTETQIAALQEERPAVADFNYDGLKDMAVLQKSGEGGHEVAIYIRTPDDDNELSADPNYFKGGIIKSHWDGKVIGVMSRPRSGMVDLLLLIARPGSDRNEFIRFQSDGTRFTEQRLVGNNLDGVETFESPHD